MDYRRQTPQALDAEHRASLGLYGKLEQALVARDREGLVRLAGPLARHRQAEVTHHFDFEERELFPRLSEAGEGDIAEPLAEEHAAIREGAGAPLPPREGGRPRLRGGFPGPRSCRSSRPGRRRSTRRRRATSAGSRSNWSSVRSPTSRRNRWRCSRCSTTCSPTRPIERFRSPARPPDPHGTPWRP